MIANGKNGHSRPANGRSAATRAGAADGSTATRYTGPQEADPLASELLDRVPPSDVRAEMSVLGSILLDPDVFDDVALVLRPADFYDPGHGQIFSTMRAIAAEGKRIDALLLTRALKKSEAMESVGGVSYLAEIAECVPHAANAKHYAEIVRDCATARALILAGCEMVQAGYEPGIEPRERLAKAESRLFAVLEDRGAQGPQPFGEVLFEALAEIDRRAENRALAGLKSGFRDIDQATGGLRGGELVILAARPSMGKSALAANIAERVALDQQKTVLFVSLEMSRLELGERMVCCRARVNSREAKNGTINAQERASLVAASNELSAAPVFIDDAPTRNMTEIASMARRLKRVNALALVVIDYLQLIEPENTRDVREQQVAQIARRLKGLARELKVPVLCLAQLNREAEKTADNRPRLRHLRESGAIEQDADMVWFVHREDYYRTDPGQSDGMAKILIEKQRGGDKAEIDLHFHKTWTLFQDVQSQQEF